MDDREERPRRIHMRSPRYVVCMFQGLCVLLILITFIMLGSGDASGWLDLLVVWAPPFLCYLMLAMPGTSVSVDQWGVHVVGNVEERKVPWSKVETVAYEKENGSIVFNLNEQGAVLGLPRRIEAMRSTRIVTKKQAERALRELSSIEALRLHATRDAIAGAGVALSERRMRRLGWGRWVVVSAVLVLAVLTAW